MKDKKHAVLLSNISATNLPLKITGIVFWGMTLVGVLVFWFLITDYENNLVEKYEARTQSAAFKINKVLLLNPGKSLKQLEVKLEKIRIENQINGIRLRLNNSSLVLGEYAKTCNIRTISLLVPNQKESSLSVCMPELGAAVADYRKNVLVSMAILFFSFGLVLQSILQKLLTNPFIDMVNTASNIVEGKADERFTETRDDEFGFLSKFINQALDTQIKQSRELSDAEQASKAKSIFLTNMSHELRTPLNAIIGYSEMLNEEIIDNNHKTDLKRIIKSAKHLLDLINDLLDMSKIEAGKIDISVERISVPLLLQNVVDIIMPVVVSNKNQIEVYCSPDVIFIDADLTKTKQVLFNLLSNACKFTENGIISIRVLVNDNNHIQFEVSDTGIGMSEEELCNIFNAYSQADASIKNRFGGTGLGLVISRKLARIMGGDIFAASVRGEGSTFTFHLPMEKDSSQSFAPNQMVR